MNKQEFLERVVSSYGLDVAARARKILQERPESAFFHVLDDALHHDRAYKTKAYRQVGATACGSYVSEDQIQFQDDILNQPL